MRTVLFWLHLCLGIAAGAVILVMSVTGVLLTYEKQMTAWMDTQNLPALSSAAPLPVETLLERARGADGKLPASVTIYSAPGQPVQASFGREVRCLDPASGQSVGIAHAGIRQFFRSVTEWHRYLAASGPSRPTGRALTGAANLAFLFIVTSGLYLWLPKVYTRASIRAVAWFRGGLRGKARDFNWHNVLGVWCVVPLFFIVLGGTVISYAWASNLVYTLTGTKPAAAAPAPAAAKGPVDLAGLNQLWQRAATQVPGWRTISLRVPASNDAPVTFVIDGGYAGQPQLRTSLTLDRAGQTLTAENFASFNAGRQWRTWLRFVHTGEYYGLPGQTIAGLATAATVILVYTGIALALRRLSAWIARRARQTVT
ncbi:MAG: PepSY domain-containing protein [Bryobacteraceae bacterium]|nr:PepSY domain-containing protein [Bryobacteraceae bacterium]